MYTRYIQTGGLILMVLACFFYSCESSGNITGETTPPSITIYNPDSNGLIINGDTLRFQGVISDNDKLHSMLLTIEGLQGQMYYSYNPNVDGLTTYNINTPWLVQDIPYDTVGYLRLQVVDINGNGSQKLWHMRLRD